MKLPTNGKPRDSLAERAEKYMATMPAAVSGQNGHDTLFTVACRLVYGFGFSVNQAVDLIETHYNPRCVPPWSQSDIRHKCEDARKAENHHRPYKHLAGDDDTPPWEKQSGDQPEKKPDEVFIEARQIAAESLLDIDQDKGEILYDCGEALREFEVGPGKITIVGAPPGAGKTSLAMQAVFAAAENHGGISVYVANAEMSPKVLINRELSGRAGVPYSDIRFGRCTPSQKDSIREASIRLLPVLGRFRLMTSPYASDRLVAGLPEGSGGIVVVDYLQKFRGSGEAIEGIEIVMGHLRHIAAQGWAVLALSSTARQQGKGGKHDPKSLDLGSFRGSGDIEFQADAAYVLRDLSGGAEGDRVMQLDCLKNRHGRRHVIDLTFIVDRMRFESDTPERHSEFDDFNNEF